MRASRCCCGSSRGRDAERRSVVAATTARSRSATRACRGRARDLPGAAAAGAAACSVVGDTPIVAALRSARCPSSGSDDRCEPGAAGRRRRPRTARRRARPRRARALRAGLELGLPYVGLVASRKRGAAVLEELRADGVAGRARSSGSTPPPGSTSARAPRPRSRLSILAQDSVGACRRSARGRAGPARAWAAPRRPLPDRTAVRPDLRDDRRGRRRHAVARGRRGQTSTSAATAADSRFVEQTRSMPPEVTGEAADEVRQPRPRRRDAGPAAGARSTTSSTRASPPRCSSACGCRSRCCSRARPASARPRPQGARAVLDTPLIRLQCYEGIDAAEALYEWNYPRQLLAIRLADVARRARCNERGPVRPRLPDPPAAAARPRASRARARRCC